MINECEDVEWKEGLLKHFNMYISFSIYDTLQKVNTLKKQPLRLRFSVTKSLKFSLRHRNSVSQIDTEVDIGASKIQCQRTLKFSVPHAEIQSPSSLNRLSPNKKQRPIGGW